MIYRISSQFDKLFFPYYELWIFFTFFAFALQKYLVYVAESMNCFTTSHCCIVLRKTSLILGYMKPFIHFSSNYIILCCLNPFLIFCLVVLSIIVGKSLARIAELFLPSILSGFASYILVTKCVNVYHCSIFLLYWSFY